MCMWTLTWRRKKSSFTRTTHLLTKVFWQWENCGIWGMICSTILLILLIWHPQTSIYSQTWINLFLESTSRPMKEFRVIDEYFTSLSEFSLPRKNTDIGETLDQVCWSQGRLCRKIKSFSNWKSQSFICRPRTFHLALVKLKSLS